MPVLTRRVNDDDLVQIGDLAYIRVQDAPARQARLAIIARGGVGVYRAEVYERMKDRDPPARPGFLVLTRGVGETVILGDAVEVMVAAVEGSGPSKRVTLGIDAPRSVAVVRAALDGPVESVLQPEELLEMLRKQ